MRNGRSEIIWLTASLGLGLLFPFAFAPYSFCFLPFILMPLFLWICLQSTPKQAFWRSLFFGTGWLGHGLWWLYISFHQFGQAPALLSAFTTLAMITALAFLFYALPGWVFRRLFSRLPTIKQCLLAFPLVWTAGESSRSLLLGGTPYFLLGYTQLNSPLAGFGPIFGVYGMSFFVALISGALVIIFSSSRLLHKIISLCIIITILVTGYLFKEHQWTHPIGKPIKVTLIQGNFLPNTNPSYAEALHQIAIYQKLSMQHLDSQLIVWPENAFPLYSQQAPKILNQLDQLAARHHTTIILGTSIYHPTTGNAYNGMLMIGEHHGEYLKKVLVPFGEYTPLPSVFGRFMQYFNLPVAGFSQGPANQPNLQINHISIAPFICWEILFQHEVLRAAKHSHILLTISDDAWFGNTIALPQLLQMAQMRSLETGRPQLVAGTTGITAFVSPLGKVLYAAPVDKRSVITVAVQPMAGSTPIMKQQLTAYS